MSFDHVQLKNALLARLAVAGEARAWSALRDAGVTGLRVPEALGGSGLAFADAAPVLEVLGELCLPTPFLETGIVAAGLLAATPTAEGDALLTAIASEGAMVAVAGLEPAALTATPVDGGWRLDGEAKIVVDALSAKAVLVLASLPGGEAAAFLVAPDAPARRPVATIDGRMAADLSFAGVAARGPIQLPACLDRVRDEAVAALCIEAAGLMRRLVRDTVAYAKQREQFGQALGSFQVVQHRLVDMNIQARRAAAIARRAVAAIDGDPIERAHLVSAAKVTAARAGRFVGQNAVQLHGGMGMTQELIVGRCFKRLTVIEGQLGGTDHHLTRFSETGAAA
jgi:alkylation response protein AidB-like acyl-CoA dehydrogenase